MQKVFEKISNPLFFILVAALLRLVPHLPNFAPIGAMALFGGVYLGRRQAVVLPLAAMFFSDIFLGFDGLASRISVYGSFVLISVIGIWLKKHRGIKTTVVASLSASTLFFVITNFSVWAFGTIYPKTVEGLGACFVAAIPFFRNTIAGDLFYVGVLFGAFELVKALAMEKKLAFIKKEA